MSTGASLLVAETGGMVIAWLSAFCVPPEAELRRIAVAGKWRRRGVAAALLATLGEKLVCTGGEQLFAEVRARNRPALNFYWKSGFVQVGYRRGYYTDPPDDALVIALELVPAVRGTGDNDENSQRS